MAKLKVYVKNNQTEVKVPVGIRLLIRRCCQAVLSTEGYKENAEVSVSFVSNTEIKKLNGIYRNKDSVTDVLSFPLSVNGETEISKETGYCTEGISRKAKWIPMTSQTCITRKDERTLISSRVI